MSDQTHWEQVYSTKARDAVSWYQPRPETSLRLIQALELPASAALIDVGAGASGLPDELLALGFTDITLLDLSAAGLELTRQRLGPVAEQLHWLVGDIIQIALPAARFDLWHDRAVLHFLTEPEQQAAYVNQLRQALRPGGHVLLATFAPDGPERCSNLPVRRYDAPALAALLGNGFCLMQQQRERHVTPWGSEQLFQWVLFQDERPTGYQGR